MTFKRKPQVEFKMLNAPELCIHTRSTASGALLVYHKYQSIPVADLRRLGLLPHATHYSHGGKEEHCSYGGMLVSVGVGSRPVTMLLIKAKVMMIEDFSKLLNSLATQFC